MILRSTGGDCGACLDLVEQRELPVFDLSELVLVDRILRIEIIARTLEFNRGIGDRPARFNIVQGDLLFAARAKPLQIAPRHKMVVFLLGQSLPSITSTKEFFKYSGNRRA